MPEDREASLLKRLARPRESDLASESAEFMQKKGKGGTYRQQQLAEEELRAARRNAAREEVKLKEEEREIARAQIYAVNKLCQKREEAAFAEYRLQREAEALGAEEPPAANAGSGGAPSDGSGSADSEDVGSDGEASSPGEAKLPRPPTGSLAAAAAHSPRGRNGASVQPKGVAAAAAF